MMNIYNRGISDKHDYSTEKEKKNLQYVVFFLFYFFNKQKLSFGMYNMFLYIMRFTVVGCTLRMSPYYKLLLSCYTSAKSQRQDRFFDRYTIWTNVWILLNIAI